MKIISVKEYSTVFQRKHLDNWIVDGAQLVLTSQNEGLVVRVVPDVRHWNRSGCSSFKNLEKKQKGTSTRKEHVLVRIIDVYFFIVNVF